MIISRTPFRISFFGGGTDYPSWYRHHGGAVLATTIDKYSYLLCRHLPPFFDFRYSIVYSQNERCKTIGEITHPAVRAVLKHLKFDRGVHLAHHGDLPARSGMGSSSAFTVGLLQTLHALRGRMVSKAELAREALHVEQELLKEYVGSQDQILAACGGFNHITFATDGSFTVESVTVSRERLKELNDHLMLFYTGIRRTASAVAASFVPTIHEHESHLRALGDMVKEGIAALSSSRDITAFGRLLHEAWREKQSLATTITNAHVDGMYEAACSAGALGGKLLGAGGGGFMLLFVPPECQPAVREHLARFVHVPFRFEFVGSQIVFADQEEDYSFYDQPERLADLADFQELDDLMEAV